jgi:hypothetical protein
MVKIPQRIVDLYAELNRTVVEYESDTFSASAAGLKGEESDKITEEIAAHALKQLVDLETLDGLRLSDELENIRQEKD